MATDEGDCILSAVEIGEGLLKVAMEGSLAGDDTAGRHRRSMSSDRSRCSFDDGWVLIEAKVIVRGKIRIAPLADPNVCAQPRIVALVEGVGQAEQLRKPAMLEKCLVCWDLCEATGLDGTDGRGSGWS